MKTYKIARVLYPSGWLPYYVEYIDGVYAGGAKFDTLSELKKAYGITKLKKEGSGWAINPRGTKKVWVEYVGEGE